VKVVIFGGSGLIGRKLVELLRERGHDARAASPSSGVDILTGKGLLAALQDAEVVIDVSRSRLFDGGSVAEFFERSTRNMLASAIAANVRHYLALTVANAAEELVANGSIPYTVVTSLERVERLASDEAARALAELALGPPRNGKLELAIEP
jgi:uncharacterized protein YbjT (DUF2867 family)